MAITLTPTAIAEIKRQRQSMNMPDHFLRVGVQGGGCCGASYALGLDNESRTDDFVFDFDGLKVAVDPESFPMLEGRKLDFVNGPMGMGFKFEGPALEMKAGGGCGCGAGGCGSHGASHAEEEEEMSGGGCGSGGCGCSH